VSEKEGLAAAAASTNRSGPLRRMYLRGSLATAAFWLLGSAVVAVAQPNTDRSIAAAGAAAAGIATILAVARLTPDPGRRYFRSLVGTFVVVSVVGDWLVQHLISGSNSFIRYGLDTRIALPLIVVLLAPLVLGALPARLRSRALWHDRALILREARPLDWVAAAYALLILPDLALGVAHHAPKSYIGQDLGLIVFFLFAYVAGRTVDSDTGREMAAELVTVLLLLAAAQKLFGWDTTPIFTYVEAACAGALAFMLFQPRKPQLVAVGVLALVLLGADAVAIKNGTGSTTAVELAAALGVIGYLVVRTRKLLPEWAVVAIAVAAVVGFLSFTADGVTVRGQYHGADESQIGRTYEAHQVREAVHSSPVSFLFGRGLGGSIDETKAPKLFAESLVYGGRDLAHVQQVHLLPYEFLLKYGLLGFVWLATFVVAVSILGLRALEAAARRRDATPVVYAALPLLGIAAALAAATHFQDNPLHAFAVGVLVTRLEAKASPSRVLRFAVPVVAVGFAALGAVAFAGRVGPFPFPLSAGGWTNSVGVGHVRVRYPPEYHRRYFKTSDHAVTGVHGVRVRGVVIASYPLRPRPELGGKGEVLRANGLFFELYQLPRRQKHPAPTRPFPLTIYDFPDIEELRNTPALEQGGVAFNVKGRDYRAILWVGKLASRDARVTIDGIVDSIRVK
jgi:hypothetical protein